MAETESSVASTNPKLQTYVVQCTTCGILGTHNVADSDKPHGRKLVKILEVGRVHKQKNPKHIVQFVTTYQITEEPGANGCD